MYPIHDTDAQLLLATLIAAKRRPAALTDIVAAAEFMGFPVTAPGAWATAFGRFVTHGLLSATGEGYVLTPAAVQLVEGLPRKAAGDERVFLVRERLSAWKPAVEHPGIEISAAHFETALQDHAKLAQQGGKNLLMPKPKRDDEDEGRRPYGRRPAGNRFGNTRRRP
ncbi:hypothetical protein [Thauera sp.]|jgi:hypothetical protein|uniref:hypothetical protein n=1 Tax=Thauera sp. TaxID=1905334 RepID=UPI00263867AA|nr:hypothetical protein [Thauera sp.]MCK6409144.1 hypothetical protein [Thauera sp.]